MKFERGRKKNQLIWSFILRDIASQSLVTVLFLIKLEKENVSGENMLSKQRRRTRNFAPSLNQRGRARGSLTVGPGDPRVRFDWSPSPSFLSARTVAGLWRSPSTNGSSPRGPEGRDGSASLGRSFRWSLGRRGWKESPAASSATEEVSVGFGVPGCGGSWSRLRGWAAP